MDRVTLLHHLARIEEYVEHGQRLLTRQQCLIEELASRGEDTRIPAALKRDLEEDLALHLADRRRLLAHLNVKDVPCAGQALSAQVR